MTVATAPTLTTAQFEELRGVARRRAGLELDPALRPAIESRLGPRLRELDIGSFDLYLRFLTSGPHQSAEFQEALGRIVGDGEGFFDDPAQFEAFDRWALPRILEGRKRARRIRVWSAGCARGGETYTLAMLIARALGPSIGAWRVEVFGTDLREKAVATASEGSYPVEATEPIPPDLRRDHFRIEAGFAQVHSCIADLTRFEPHNLLDRAGARQHGVWDAVFCRNVMGSMDPVSARRTLALLIEQVSPGGFLFVGRGESIPGLETLHPIPLPCAGFQNQADDIPGADHSLEARP